MSDMMNRYERLNSAPVFLLLESEETVVKSLPENLNYVAKPKGGAEFELPFNSDLAVEAIHGGKEISEAEYLAY
jgi:hypothetical protein